MLRLSLGPRLRVQLFMALTSSLSVLVLAVPSRHPEERLSPLGSKAAFAGQAAGGVQESSLTTHKLSCGLWRVDGGFSSTIRIKNSLVVGPIEVTPLLYMADGTAYTLPPVRLAVSGVATVNVNAALATAPSEIREHVSAFGSAALHYTYETPGHVLGSIEVLDLPRSLIFVYPFSGHPEEEPSTQMMEGVWWRLTPEVGGFVALANTTAASVTATLQVQGSGGTALVPRAVEIPPHGTVLPDLGGLTGGLPGLENQAGGIRVEFDGRPEDLIVTGGLLNESIGYSASMPFWARDHRESDAAMISYASAGIMVGDADPTAGFPGGTRFSPYAALRNTTASPLTVKASVNFMAGSQPITRSLPDVQLAPFETRYFAFERFFETLGLRGLSGMINVATTFEGHPGDLVLATGSTDQSGTYVFEVEPQGVGRSFSKEGHYWKVTEGFDAMFTMWNPTEDAQDFLVTLFFGEDQGQYKLPVSLGPKASTTIDVSKVIGAQQPDADGNVIPLGTREGSFVFSSARGMTEWMTLAASIGILNVQAATCGTECVNCCAITATVTPSNATIAVNGTVNLVAKLTDCSGTPKLVAWSWSSGSPSVATVNSVGVVTGVAPGSAGITARSLEQVVIVTGTVCNQSGTCPTGYLQAGANVTVYDFTVSISPSTIRPTDTGGTNQMAVTVQTNPFVSQSVTLADQRINGSGGHPTNHPTTLPSGTGGTFSPSSGSTSSSDGKFTSTYTGRIFGGEHYIRATMQGLTKTAPTTLRAMVSGLQQLSGATNYYNSNSPAGQIAHPDNWWGTSTTLNGLVSTANAYVAQYPGERVPYNDISLLWGGKFDGNSYNWTGGHAEHRVGRNCDVNVCSWTQDRKNTLWNMFGDAAIGGATGELDECSTNNTWHVTW